MLVINKEGVLVAPCKAKRSLIERPFLYASKENLRAVFLQHEWSISATKAKAVA